APVFILPRHGGPGEPDRKFGAKELAEAVRPRWALVPVGTHAPVAKGEQRSPHPDLVHALRDGGANILCTQITRRCALEKDLATSARPVLAPTSQLYDLGVSGRACAGTILVAISPGAQPRVARADDHAAAVDDLEKLGEPRPLCRGGAG